MDLGSREKAVRGVAWTSVSNWGCQLLSFGVYAGLARLLNPQVFGLVALAGVYIAFIQIFVTQGFGTALIQRRDLEEDHLDSAFWIAMATASLFCLFSILLAGPIASLFRNPGIAPVIRWLSCSILFYAMSSVPMAILSRGLDFRALAVRSLVTTGVGGTVGLAMAFFGWGVWSLVGQQLAGAVLGCICLWSAVPWRPRLQISKRHLRDLYRISLSMTGNDILWFFSQKSDQTMVGYGFAPSVLGPYSLASRVITLLHDGIVGPFQTVAFPTFSKLQSEPLEFERVLHRFCEITSFLCLPVFTGTAIIAPYVVPLLFGSKWIAAVPILQVLAFYGALRVVLAFMHPLMLAKGRAELYLLMNVILSILTFAGCLVAVRWSPKAIALSMIASMLVSSAIFLVVARRLLAIRTRPLLKSFAFPVLSSLLMLAAVGLLRIFVTKGLAPVNALAVCAAAGAVVYVSTALLLRRDLVKAICKMAGSSLIPSRQSGSAGLPRIEAAMEKTTVGLAEP
jgi:O-antigen/teichoic acid export membrane protein